MEFHVFVIVFFYNFYETVDPQCDFTHKIGNRQFQKLIGAHQACTSRKVTT